MTTLYYQTLSIQCNVFSKKLIVLVNRYIKKLYTSKVDKNIRCISCMSPRLERWWTVQLEAAMTTEPRYPTFCNVKTAAWIFSSFWMVLRWTVFSFYNKFAMNTSEFRYKWLSKIPLPQLYFSKFKNIPHICMVHFTNIGWWGSLFGSLILFSYNIDCWKYHLK